MVKVRYLGLADPAKEIEQLKPAGRALSAWRLKYKPQGPEYLAICEALAALDRVGQVVAGQDVAPNFGGGTALGGQRIVD